MFPSQRLRRNRFNEKLRNLVSESRPDHTRMIMPVFVSEDAKAPEKITGMKNILRYPVDSVADYCSELEKLGLGGILLFGIPSKKDAAGSESYNDSGVVQESIRKIRKKSSIPIIADLCMCEYTDHGHCGILNGNNVDNDATLESYARIALSYARAGVDMVAPSGMMDGQVVAIRKALDSSSFSNTPIMAYSTKYASSLYGPFREAAGSSPSFGDRRSYQMDYRNAREALRENAEDESEGADILMVKPAIFYLDVIYRSRQETNLPLAAYSVSGEYSMILNAVDSGLVARDFILESLTAPFRAGADILITYFAESYARSIE